MTTYKNKQQLASMSYEEIQSYMDEIEPAIDKAINDSYSAPTVQGHMSIAAEVGRPFNLALKFKKLKQTDFELESHDNIGDLMTFEEFKENVECGGFIDYDGFGYYATSDKQSDIIISPSDIKAEIHRDDFTHVKWYNR